MEVVAVKRRGRPRKNPVQDTMVMEKPNRGRPKKVTNRGRGRPELYGAGFIRAFKKIVKKYGLLQGQKVINAEGVVVNGKQVNLTISLPTLSKYVKRVEGGSVLVLKRGRPRDAA